MRHLLPALVAAFALASAPARADTRLTIDLRWENIPRANASIRVAKLARVTERAPRADVTYLRTESGLQVLTLTYPEGFGCTTSMAKGDSALTLHCGRPGGMYQLSKPYEGNVHLEWIDDGTASVSRLVTQ